MSGIYLKLLGQFECSVMNEQGNDVGSIHDKGSIISFQTRKAEVLLAYLALSPGIRHPRERLINLLWSNRSEEQARNSLRQALSAIKKPLSILEVSPLEVDRTTVQLIPNLIQSDVDLFLNSSSERNIDQLTTAAALYQGEFLEGINIRDAVSQAWLAHERDRFKRVIVEVLTELSTQQLADNEYAAAIESAETLVEYDPLQESAWRRLMQAYQSNRERNHALLAFKRCQDLLQRELGVEPENQTIELRNQIRDGKLDLIQNVVTNNFIPPVSKNEHRQSKQETTLDNSILVLPFENLSNDSEQRYFSEGITEGVIVGLSNYPSLNVLSRHFSFALQDQKLTMREIANQYHVRYVVEGSVRKTPTKLRITAQLVSTDTGQQIWGKRFDSDQEKIFDIEDELTRTIVSHIKGKMDATDEVIAYRKPSLDLTSYDLLMKGKYHLGKFNPIDNDLGRKALESCVAVDPECDIAHNYLYRINILDWLSGWTEPRDVNFEKAQYHIEQAVVIGSDESIIQASYAEFLLFNRQYDECEIRAERAYRLNSNDVETLATLSSVHAGLGNVEIALEMADACRALDPFHPWIDWVNGIAYYTGKRYEDAFNTFKQMPNPSDEIEGWLAACCERMGQHTAAERHLQKYVETVRENMTNPPSTLEDWHRLWQATSSAKHDYGSDYPFNALCDAGLESFIEDSGVLPVLHSKPSIVVLPFDNLSGNPDQEYFSDGITESIIYNLSLFADIVVKSRNSSFAFKEQLQSLGEISKKLNVDYVVEGSIRKTTERIRVTVQLVEARTGNQVWGKRYDSNLDDIFTLEEELSRSVAATITGRIDSYLQKTAKNKRPEDQQSYDLMLSGIYHYNKFTSSDNVIALNQLHLSLKRQSENSRAHAYLYACHVLDWMELWTDDPEESFRLAGEHAVKALELDPENLFAILIAAEWHLFSQRYDICRSHIQKALGMNANDPEVLAQKAFLETMLGQFDEAIATVESCMELDPYHPWCEWLVTEVQYYKQNYQEAVRIAQNIVSTMNAPAHVRLFYIVCQMKLGRESQAKSLMKEFLAEAHQSMKSMPQSEDQWKKWILTASPMQSESYLEDALQELLKAGLCDETRVIDISDSASLPTIAILPFNNLSGDPDQQYFSDGLSENIIRGLGMYKGLIVKSSASSFPFRDSDDAISDIAEKLQVKYVIDGSVRKAGNKIRLTAQLIETSTGNQLWGKHYDADLEDVLTLEEELSHTVSGTIRGRIDSDIQRSALMKPSANLQSYDLYLRGIYHVQKFGAEDQRLAKKYLIQAIELDPDNANAHAYLAGSYFVELEENLMEDRRKTMDIAKFHIERAVALQPDNAFAHGFMAEYLMYEMDFDRAEFHADKAIELNPTLPDGYAMKGWALSSTRRLEESMAYADKAQKLDPHHAYNGWIVGEVYRTNGEYERAIDTYRSLPDLPNTVHLQIAICYAGMGKLTQAKAEMQHYLEYAKVNMTNFPDSIESWYEYLYFIFSFQFEEDAKFAFELALKAGLCDDLENESVKLPSIAVLPFKNLSEDPEQGFFSDGVTSDIINILSKFRYLRTVSGYSTALYKDRSASISQIAEEQNVRYILDGGIRKQDNKIRINAQLIDSVQDEAIWSEQYDRTIDDIFAIQDELAVQVASAMKVTLIDGDRSQTRGMKNIKAWECCILAIELSDSYIMENIAKARQLILKAIELDPEYVAAWSLFGWTHWQESYSGWSDNIEVSLNEVEKAVDRCIELDAEYWETWTLKGFMHVSRDEPELAVEACHQGATLAPGNFDAVVLSGFALSYSGRYKEAVEVYEKSLHLCPICPNWARVVGAIAYQKTGQIAKAIEAFKQGIEIEPDSSVCQYYLMDLYIEEGKMKLAQELADEIKAMPNPLRLQGVIQTISHESKERERFKKNMKMMGFH